MGGQADGREDHLVGPGALLDGLGRVLQLELVGSDCGGAERTGLHCGRRLSLLQVVSARVAVALLNSRDRSWLGGPLVGWGYIRIIPAVLVLRLEVGLLLKGCQLANADRSALL